MNLTERLADELIPHTVDLLAYSEHIRENVLLLLLNLQEELAAELEDTIPDVGTESYRLARARALQSSVQSTIGTAYGKIHGDTQSQLVQLAKQESSFVQNMSERVIGFDLLSAGPSASRLKAVAESALITGTPAKEWWSGQARSLQQRFTGEVRTGILAGETTQQIVRRVRGKSVGRRKLTDANGKSKTVHVFSGGVLDASTRDATALVRTAVQKVSNDSLMETYKANADVLQGVQVIVTLDGRTSPICIARSGGAWDFEGNPLPQSRVKQPYPGSPPWHFNCRSVMLPITKTFDELLGTEGVPEIGPGTRASMDGQVAGDLNYEDWLKTKPEDFQRKVLGPGRYELWKNGELSLQRLVDPTGKPITLKELKDRPLMRLSDEEARKRRNEASRRSKAKKKRLEEEEQRRRDALGPDGRKREDELKKEAEKKAEEARKKAEELKKEEQRKKDEAKKAEEARKKAEEDAKKAETEQAELERLKKNEASRRSKRKKTLRDKNPKAAGETDAEYEARIEKLYTDQYGTVGVPKPKPKPDDTKKPEPGKTSKPEPTIDPAEAERLKKNEASRRSKAKKKLRDENPQEDGESDSAYKKRIDDLYATTTGTETSTTGTSTGKKATAKPKAAKSSFIERVLKPQHPEDAAQRKQDYETAKSNYEYFQKLVNRPPPQRIAGESASSYQNRLNIFASQQKKARDWEREWKKQQLLSKDPYTLSKPELDEWKKLARARETREKREAEHRRRQEEWRREEEERRKRIEAEEQDRIHGSKALQKELEERFGINPKTGAGPDPWAGRQEKQIDAHDQFLAEIRQANNRRNTNAAENGPAATRLSNALREIGIDPNDADVFRPFELKKGQTHEEFMADVKRLAQRTIGGDAEWTVLDQTTDRSASLMIGVNDPRDAQRRARQAAVQHILAWADVQDSGAVPPGTAIPQAKLGLTLKEIQKQGGERPLAWFNRFEALPGGDYKDRRGVVSYDLSRAETTDSRRYTARHELGHLLHNQNAYGQFSEQATRGYRHATGNAPTHEVKLPQRMGTYWGFTPSQMRVLLDDPTVTHYGRSQPVEFIAETFATMMNGYTPRPKTLELYRQLGGAEVLRIAKPTKYAQNGGKL